MKLKKIIPNEVTQAEKDRHFFSHGHLLTEYLYVCVSLESSREKLLAWYTREQRQEVIAAINTCQSLDMQHPGWELLLYRVGHRFNLWFCGFWKLWVIKENQNAGVRFRKLPCELLVMEVPRSPKQYLGPLENLLLPFNLFVMIPRCLQNFFVYIHSTFPVVYLFQIGPTSNDLFSHEYIN